MNAESPFSPDEQVVQWLLNVARRADESVRALKPLRSLDRRVWLRAECEVFELAERTSPDRYFFPPTELLRRNPPLSQPV